MPVTVNVDKESELEFASLAPTDIIAVVCFCTFSFGRPILITPICFEYAVQKTYVVSRPLKKLFHL